MDKRVNEINFERASGSKHSIAVRGSRIGSPQTHRSKFSYNSNKSIKKRQSLLEIQNDLKELNDKLMIYNSIEDNLCLLFPKRKKKEVSSK